MTEEEINKKAEKHCNEVLCNAHEKCNEFIKCRDWRSRRAGFFCGYEQALKDLEKENAELIDELKKWKDGIALKDEEIGCIETEFNTFKSKAKDHIKKLLDCLKQDTNDPQTNYYVCQYMDKAEQFLSEVEK